MSQTYYNEESNWSSDVHADEYHQRAIKQNLFYLIILT